MEFAKLITYFEELEQTSSRLALIEILTNLFKETNKDTIDKIIYLAQGRVAPFYAPIEIGMADKMVAQAISLAYGVTKEDALKLYNKLGDMGLVAEELSLRPQEALFNGEKRKELTVAAVFEGLLLIAQTAGEGSVDKKISILQSLLFNSVGKEVKHLVRIPLGNNRLGIGDPTILDGLATAYLGDKTQRNLLEKAYNETSDLGLIGKTLLEGGLSEVEKLGVTIGRPIRSMLCERLPSSEKVIEKMGPVVHVTPKYDGFRVQIHKDGNKVEMYSRNLETMTHMFPELIEGTLKQVKAKTAILDCEALAYNAESEEYYPFQETTKRRRKHNIEEVAAKLPLHAFVFDMLYLDGKSLIDLPLEERITYIEKTVEKGDILLPAPGEMISDPKVLQLRLEDSISKGLEGVVIKKPSSPYEAGGRNFNWVKLKRHNQTELQDSVDCVILGYIVGKGKRTAFGAGALLVGVYDKKSDEFVSVCKIGTGLTDEEWISIKEKVKGKELDHKPARVKSILTPSVWVEPEIVIEVLADEITRSPIHTAGMGENSKEQPGYALRFPRLLKFRDKDKNPEDATSVDELIKMYESQGKKS